MSAKIFLILFLLLTSCADMELNSAQKNNDEPVIVKVNLPADSSCSLYDGAVCITPAVQSQAQSQTQPPPPPVFVPPTTPE